MRNDRGEGGRCVEGDMKQLADEISCVKQKPCLILIFRESIQNSLMTFSSDE